MARKHIEMAIAYDFDGTLADGNMQEHQFLPDIGMKPAAFWAEVKRLTKEHQADEVLVYMNLMLRKAAAAGVPVRREDFKARGKAIQLFEGVEDWFDRITGYGRAQGVRITHYLVSSGNAEIFAGTPIASKFAQVYASKFMFDENGVAAWPALAVNYTTKTQYLFRINKGVHNHWEDERINRFIPDEERPIPFDRMIFLGDGDTDVPTMKMMHTKGGFSIAVYDPRNSERDQQKIYGLISEDRVNFVAAADYREGTALDLIVKGLLGRIAINAGTMSDI